MAATDLACDDCAQPAAMLALFGAGVVLVPLAAIGARMAWGICRDPLARHIAGMPW